MQFGAARSVAVGTCPNHATMPTVTDRESSTDRPLLVIFGAGATFDSIRRLARVGGLVDRPPLAQELFGDRYDSTVQLHPSCGPLVAHLRSLPATANLEMELDRLRVDEAPKSALRRRQLIALRFYLRDVLKQAANFERNAPAQTNYHLLIEQLVLWQEATGNHISLVTFNYDTMLEKAVSDVTSRPIVDLEDYVADERLRVFKPHGSVDWARITENDRDPRRAAYPPDVEQHVVELAGAGALSMSDSFLRVDTSATAVSNEKLLVPALTVPVQQKGAFEFPDAHKGFLAEALSSGSGPLKVLTIGWRGGELHFLNFWNENHGPSQPQLLTISGDEAAGINTVGALRASGLRFVGVRALDGGFSHVLGKPLAEFLAAPMGGYPYWVG